MRRGWKIALKVFAGLVLVVLLLGLGGWWYLSTNFLDFEDTYTLEGEIPEGAANGYRYLDRNRNGQLDPYEDGRLPVEQRVEDLLSRMTPEEKIHLLKGSGLASALGQTEEGEGIPGAVGTIVPTPRLGIPTVYLSDGPAGLRIEPRREGEERTYYCTAFPIATLLASSWNTPLVEQVGAAMGNEALEYGLDVILGPGANIHRHPFCGRNFEYYSEDPILTGYMGAAMVNGIESNGVGSSVKHYVANNQETNRNFNNVLVSQRALREIYLKGFEIIVRESQPWTIMSSYNKVNGTFVSQSPKLLTGVLREDWGFKGLVMSDWFGGQDAPSMVRAGNDLLEPGTKKQWDALTEAYEEGSLSQETIDRSVRRILSLVLASRKMQGYAYSEDPDLEAHARTARQAAAEGMVLLKNEDALPLARGARVALLGVTSYDFIVGGTGSGDVNEAYSVSLEEGLKNTSFAPEEGLAGTGFQLSGLAKNAYTSHRDSLADAFVKPEGIDAMLEPYNPPEMAYSLAGLRAIADESDVAVVTIGRNSGEGGDRVLEGDFRLTEKEKNMLNMACEVFHKQGKQVVVVLNIGGVIETASWKQQPDAVLLAWQGGQEGGNAVADILSGAVNPSGKLPMTFPVRASDHASHANFPLDGEPMDVLSLMFGTEPDPEEERIPNKDYTEYEEGIYVGYRHFDKAGLDVSYPFGYGLSYTEFQTGDIAVSGEADFIEVSATVRNTGQRAGKEVLQVYVSRPESRIDRPLRELKAFSKTPLLQPGEEESVTLRIPLTELRYWDEAAAAWKLEPGEYEVHVGTSSRDLQEPVSFGL